MFDLSKPKPKPPMITIVGSPGVGKSSLAALFPNPVFIQAESAGTVFETWDEEAQPVMFPELPKPDRRNGISTITTIKEQIKYLATTEHEFKTLVIDSITTLHRMVETEICQEYQVDNVADAAGGFHKGYIVAAERHANIKATCDRLREVTGMAIVFLAHTGIQKMKNRPDADDYTVFTLDMHEKSVNQYVNVVDAVLYLRNQEYITDKKQDKKGNLTKYGKAMATGDRQLITSGDGQLGYVNAKNRYSLPVEIDVPHGENPLLELIPFFKQGVTNETT